MSPAAERVRAGNVDVYLDGPNIRSPSLLSKLRRAAGIPGVRLVVPATAFVELLLDEHQFPGRTFDAEQVEGFLRRSEVRVAPLDRTACFAVAARLAGRFPTDALWQEAKRAALRVRFDVDASRVPATIDWFNACTCPADAVYVTDDDGPESEHLERLRTHELEQILDEIAPE